ncbi:hypothetical protein SRABI26_00366 [Arthrobacter sp. Bi26]|nr:hypothetical protein SRABI26_00366 [Arthrobacter sp. Bi26]
MPPEEPYGNRAAGTSPHNPSEVTNPVTARTDSNVNQKFRYLVYHSFMSLTDFLAWVERNDGSEPDIWRIQGR